MPYVKVRAEKKIAQFGRINVVCVFGIKTLDSTIYNLYIVIMTAREIMNILKANGWKLERINGSHHVFGKFGCRPVSVPFHGNKDIGNLGKRILKEAGIN